jgi:single-strand DNA-binding protein
MAGSYNKISIIGNVGRDPEARQLASGDNVASFTVATTERSKNGDQTTWFRVSAFAQLADVCQRYLRKGSYIYIEGSLTQREYTDRDGATRQSLDVRAREMRMLDKAGEGGQGGNSGGAYGDDQGQGAHGSDQGGGTRAAGAAVAQSAPGFDDDIPF